MLDLSNLKTWTDGLWGVISAPHIVLPLLAAVAIAGWWFRGTEKASPETIALTADYTAALISSASVALHGAMKAYEKADEAKLTTSPPST